MLPERQNTRGNGKLGNLRSPIDEIWECVDRGTRLLEISLH